MQDRLAVPVAAKAMAGALEATAERPIVVDFSVEDHPDQTVFAGHRLTRALEIDDAQPAETQADAEPTAQRVAMPAIEPRLRIVRPAVRD